MEHLARVLRLVQSLSREYYRPDVAEVMRPSERVRAIAARYQDAFPGIAYECDVTSEIDATILPVGAISYLVGEVLENASRACSASAHDSAVRLSVTRSAQDRTLSIECRDSGPGFPDEVLERIHAEQLAPPEEPGTGGYGLYLMMQIAKRLGGTILASNGDPPGARIQVLLPSGGDAQWTG